MRFFFFPEKELCWGWFRDVYMGDEFLLII